MFFNSYRNKGGLTGGDLTDGFAVGKTANWQWKLFEKARGLGIFDPTQLKDIKNAKANEADGIINSLSGYTVHAKMPGGGKLADPVPLEFGGRTYMVGDEGIKLINEEFLDEIVTEQIERENYITDVCSLFLYSGDIAIKVVSIELYTELAKKDVPIGTTIYNCLPSTIRTTTDASAYGQLYLAMKNKVSKVIDNVVIPEKTLEKARNVKRQEIDAKQVRTVEAP